MKATNHTEERSKGIIGTILFYVIMLALLYFFGFKSETPDTEEGVLISYGTTTQGSGTVQPKPAAQQSSTSSSTPTTATSTPTPTKEQGEEEVKTQDYDEEAPVVESGEKKPKETINKPDPEEEKRKTEEAARLKKEQEEALKKQKEAEERKRKEAEEAARKQKIQDELAKLDQQYANQNQSTSDNSDNPFSGKGTEDSKGQGDSNFPGNAGNQNGDANSTASAGNGLGKSGNSFSLAGRKLTGNLPTPRYNVQEEGTVVVEIIVDRDGNVISATPILKGSSTQNAELWKVAAEAAKKAKFNADGNAAVKQVGTITYHFQLD